MPSRSLPADFQGAVCPTSMNFGFAHGTSAAVGTVVIPGRVYPRGGEEVSLRVLNSSFYGSVIGYSYDYQQDQTEIRLVDWRDRLRDVLFFGAFNMQEEDGRFYHIFPGESWEKQQRTYINRVMVKEEFWRFQLLKGRAFTIGYLDSRLASSATLLQYFATLCNFQLQGDPQVMNILGRTYPPNMDWNTGSYVIDIIQQIVEKSNAQFTCFGKKDMYLTIRGKSENAFINKLANQGVNPCTIGADKLSLGEEINEKGRRVKIVGDRNKHQWTFPCKANWPPAWTFDMAMGGIKLQAILRSKGLTLLDKIKDMPPEFHDTEVWDGAPLDDEADVFEKKSRMDMEIQEYVNTIPFKVYVVDFSHIILSSSIRNPTPDIRAEYVPLDMETLKDKRKMDEEGFPVEPGLEKSLKDYPVTVGYDDAEINSLYPPSRSTVTDSNLQSIVYSSTRKIIRGEVDPFSEQKSMVPRRNAGSMNVEEVVGFQGKVSYRVRVTFGEAQFWRDEKIEDFRDPKKYQPDYVAVTLALDREIYTHEAGEKKNGIRVREQRVSVRNLYKGFLDGKEVFMLRENYIADMAKTGAKVDARGIMADDMAKSIATQMLAHENVTKSGSLDFEDRTGMTPDGIIETVSVSFDASSGVRETVSFSNTYSTEPTSLSAPSGVIGQKRKWDDDLVKDALRVASKDALHKRALDSGVTAVGVGIGLIDAFGNISLVDAFANADIVKIAYPKEVVATLGKQAGAAAEELGKIYSRSVLALKEMELDFDAEDEEDEEEPSTPPAPPTEPPTDDPPVEPL